MRIALWIVQVLLAVAFFMAGTMKAFTPAAELAAEMPWVNGVPGWVPRLAGFSELLASIGLVLPAATRIKPVLTPFAALGLVAVMVLAALFHVTRGEWAMLAPNLVLASLAAFVAWGRLKRAPIEPRGTSVPSRARA